MQCPNCKLTIKDDSKMCIHCGMTFDNYGVIPPSPQQDFYQTDRPVEHVKPHFVENKSAKVGNALAITVVVVAIIGILLAVSSLFPKTINRDDFEKTKKDTAEVRNIKFAKEYYATAYDKLLLNSMIPEDKTAMTDGYYYIMINEKETGTSYPINQNKENNKDTYGYILIHTDSTTTPHKVFYLCIQNDNGKYDELIPTRVKNDRFSIDQESSKCEIEDFSKLEAKKLIAK